MDAIKALFKPEAKITLVVRLPSTPDGRSDMILTNDLLDEAIAAILRRKHDQHGFDSLTAAEAKRARRAQQRLKGRA